MTRFGVVFAKDLREQWRTLRLPIVAIVFLVFGMASPLLAKYTPDLVANSGANIQVTMPTPTTADAVDQLIKNVGQFGSFAAILLAMGAIARERERGTAALVLSKPVSRPTFLASKFTALLVTLGISIAVGALADYAYTAALFSTLNVPGFLACCAFILVGIVVFASVTFLASTLIGSTLPAAGVGLSVYILVSIASIAPRLNHILPAGLEVPAHALALGQTPPHVWTSLGFNLLWIVGCLVASWLSFRSQEFGS